METLTDTLEPVNPDAATGQLPAPYAQQPTVEDFEWPDMTGMDHREQNLDRVARDSAPAGEPIALWPTHNVAAGLVLRQLVPDPYM